jgi:hypothetical protein
MPPARCPTCQGALDLVGRCRRCGASIADRPRPRAEEKDRPGQDKSFKLAAVDQPLIPPAKNPRPTARVPVWKRELSSGLVFLGVMGTMTVITSLVGVYIWNRAARDFKQPGEDKPSLEQLLADLGDLDPGKRQKAAERLAGAEPNHPRRDEVARALARCLKDQHPGSAAKAARALVRWGTPEVVPDLAAALPGDSGDLRNACLDALLPLKDARAAEGAARCLPTGERARARRVLETIGPPAESAVRSYVNHSAAAVRREACQVLKQIGTRASAAALEQVEQNDRDRGVKQAAKDALQAIQARGP